MQRSKEDKSTMNDKMQRRSWAVLLTLGLLGWSLTVKAQITVNTAAIKNHVGYLDFQFNPGGADAADAQADITKFGSKGGVIGTVFSETMFVSGALPDTVTLKNTDVLNELVQGFQFGTDLSFTPNISVPILPSPVPTSGTTLALFLLDDQQNVLSTTGPDDVAVLLNVNPDGTLQTTQVFTATPEPSGLLLCSLGLASGSLFLARRHHRARICRQTMAFHVA